MEKIKLDFIHIGFPKTASSFLQLYYFKEIDNLCVLNEDIDKLSENKWFFKNFILNSDEDFNKELTISRINEAIKINEESINKKNFYCISDENLSGDIYTGNNSKILMNRIYSIFGETKILIVIRNQVDWLLSAYGNFVLHKGDLSFNEWVNKFGYFLINKLKYSKLINDYLKLFSKQNINVLIYENLFDLNKGIDSFLKENFLINKSFQEKNQKKINLGRSLYLNQTIAKINRFFPTTYYARLLRNKHNKNNFIEKKFVKNILNQYQFNYKEENETICKLLNINLPNVYFE